jgi:hypothetical protein
VIGGTNVMKYCRQKNWHKISQNADFSDLSII